MPADTDRRFEVFAAEILSIHQGLHAENYHLGLPVQEWDSGTIEWVAQSIEAALRVAEVPGLRVGQPKLRVTVTGVELGTVTKDFHPDFIDDHQVAATMLESIDRFLDKAISDPDARDDINDQLLDKRDAIDSERDVDLSEPPPPVEPIVLACGDVNVTISPVWD